MKLVSKQYRTGETMGQVDSPDLDEELTSVLLDLTKLAEGHIHLKDSVDTCVNNESNARVSNGNEF